MPSSLIVGEFRHDCFNNVMSVSASGLQILNTEEKPTKCTKKVSASAKKLINNSVEWCRAVVFMVTWFSLD